MRDGSGASVPAARLALENKQTGLTREAATGETGEYALSVPHTYGAGRLHRLIPNSELVLFRESGHFPFVEEHDSFTAIVGDWLERLHGCGLSSAYR